MTWKDFNNNHEIEKCPSNLKKTTIECPNCGTELEFVFDCDCDDCDCDECADKDENDK